MFCLRTWIPVLFFISNVSPIYFILFVSATYYLNRPCVYCSLLLTILVFSIYDFHNNWFEPQPMVDSADTYGSSEDASILQNATLEHVSAAVSAISSTLSSVAQSALQGFKRKPEVNLEEQISVAAWLKELLGKKEWRIPCIDVAVRL